MHNEFTKILTHPIHTLIDNAKLLREKLVKYEYVHAGVLGIRPRFSGGQCVILPLLLRACRRVGDCVDGHAAQAPARAGIHLWHPQCASNGEAAGHQRPLHHWSGSWCGCRHLVRFSRWKVWREQENISPKLHQSSKFTWHNYCRRWNNYSRPTQKLKGAVSCPILLPFDLNHLFWFWYQTFKLYTNELFKEEEEKKKTNEKMVKGQRNNIMANGAFFFVGGLDWLLLIEII